MIFDIVLKIEIIIFIIFKRLTYNVKILVRKMATLIAGKTYSASGLTVIKKTCFKKNMFKIFAYHLTDVTLYFIKLVVTT